MKIVINTKYTKDMNYLDTYTIVNNIKGAELAGENIIIEDENIITEDKNEKSLGAYFEEEIYHLAWVLCSFNEEEDNFENIEKEIYSELEKIYSIAEYI